jgi:hypothetical protein
VSDRRPHRRGSNPIPPFRATIVDGQADWWGVSSAGWDRAIFMKGRCLLEFFKAVGTSGFRTDCIPFGYRKTKNRLTAVSFLCNFNHVKLGCVDMQPA